MFGCAVSVADDLTLDEKGDAGCAWAARYRRTDGVMSPNLKKTLIIGGVALVLFFLISQPHKSADAVQEAFGWLREGAEAIVTFVRSLFE